MELSRRAFVAGAAAVCAGCGSGDGHGDPAALADETGSSTSTTPADERVDDRPLGGFGSEIDLGTVEEVVAGIDGGGGFHYVPEGRVWIVRYPPEAAEAAEATYADGTVTAGFVALYQKCTHLGCRVPECTSSQRFECPCHGSVFNRVGEWVAGPAPRGMDRFPLTLSEGRLVVDTGRVVQGPDQGVTTLDEEPPGPSCIGF